jgi:hypothetical protein
MQIIEHKEALTSLEQQAVELGDTDEQLEQEISECQQAIEQPVMELTVVKKQLKRDTSEPLDTQKLTELAEMTKRLAKK